MNLKSLIIWSHSVVNEWEEVCHSNLYLQSQNLEPLFEKFWTNISISAQETLGKSIQVRLSDKKTHIPNAVNRIFCDHCISPMQDPCRHICSDLRERSRQRQIVRRERKEKEMSFWRSRLRRRWASWEVWKSSPLWSPTLPIPSSYKNVIIISDWTVFD